MSHLAPVTDNGNLYSWAITNKFRTEVPPPFLGPPFTGKPLPGNPKNPVINCHDEGCNYNPNTITEKSFNNLLTAMSKLTPSGMNLVIPKSYYDLSEWIPV